MPRPKSHIILADALGKLQSFTCETCRKSCPGTAGAIIPPLGLNADMLSYRRQFPHGGHGSTFSSQPHESHLYFTRGLGPPPCGSNTIINFRMRRSKVHSMLADCHAVTDEQFHHGKSLLPACQWNLQSKIFFSSVIVIPELGPQQELSRSFNGSARVISSSLDPNQVQSLPAKKISSHLLFEP